MLKILHQSDLANFMKCPFMYYMSHEQGYITKFERNAINIGKLFSTGVARLHETNDLKQAILLVQAAHDIKILKANNFQQHEDINTNACIVQAMLSGYYKNFIQNYQNKLIDILQISPEYRIEWIFKKFGIKFIYICTLDGLISSSKGIHILEIKTTSITQKDLILELPMNFQINSYWTAAYYKEVIEPSGVLYRFVQKPTIRLKQKETIDQFRERVIKEYENNISKYFFEESLYFDYKNMKYFENTQLDPAFKELVMCYVLNTWPKRGTSCKIGFGNAIAHCQYLQYCSNPTKETLNSLYKKGEIRK